MTEFKIYCLDKHQTGNKNLLAGLLSESYFLTHLDEAKNFNSSLFLYTSGLNLDISLDLFDDRKNKKTFLLVDYSFESGISKHLHEDMLQEIVKLGVDINHIVFVLNTSAKQTFDKNQHIIFCDLFAMSSVFRFKQNPNLINSHRLSHLPNKINLLLGKLDKKLRLNLIETFSKMVPEQQSLVSLLGYPKTPVNDELGSYIKNHQGPLDTAEVVDTNEGLSSQGWGSSLIYEKSSVSLVCETHQHNDLPFLTEKTFRPIINSHPFVIVSGCRSLNHLKNLGFKTFENFIDENYEDLSSNNPEKLKQAIAQSIKLLDKTSKLQEIVDYNKNYLLEYGEKEMSLLIDCLTKISNQDNR